MRLLFDKELEQLHLALINMGALVENAIEKSILALKKQDATLAKEIIRNDNQIDEMEVKIEKQCLRLLALQNPIAKDLRSVSSTLKIITDLERIGDHATDIAEITIRLANAKYIKPLVDIPKMADIARQMLRDALDSYVKRDVELAREVCKRDDEVDNLFNKKILEIIGILKTSGELVEQGVELMFVSKYLERIGDHATNIAEWVVYHETGEHKHLQHEE